MAKRVESPEVLELIAKLGADVEECEKMDEIGPSFGYGRRAANLLKLKNFLVWNGRKPNDEELRQMGFESWPQL